MMASAIRKGEREANGPRSWTSRTVFKPLILQAIVWAAFMLLDRLSSPSMWEGGIPAWYLPAGLIFAVLLWGGMRYLPVVILANFTAAVFHFHSAPLSWTGLPGSVALAVPYALGAILLRSAWGLDLRLRRLRDVGGIVFFLSAAVVLCAMVGTLDLRAEGFVTKSSYWKAAFNWWVGDSISVTSFTPLLLLYIFPCIESWLGRSTAPAATPAATPKATIVRPAVPIRRLPGISRATLETVAQFAAIPAAIWLAFGFSPAIPYQPLYALFFPVIWIAVRHGVRRTTVAILATNVGVILGAHFTRPDVQSLPRLQLVMLALALVGLCVGAIVSGRQETDQALRASEDQYRTLFNSISEPVFICDATASHFLDCNDAACKLYGYSRAEIQALKPVELHPPEERTVMRNDVAEGGFGPTQAYTHVTKDGRWLAVEIDVAPTEYRGERARIAVVRDVTEPKRVEKALRASEDKYRTLFEHVSDPIFIVDGADHHYLDCNETALKVYGYTRDELSQMTPFDLRLPEDREALQEDLRKVAASVAAPGTSGLAVFSTTTHVTKTGRRIDVEVLANAIQYQRRTAYLALVRDVTAHKAAEAHLLKAKDAAEAASRAKSEFLANMSHEIRTPLNGILGMTDLALDTQLTSEQQEYLQMLKGSAGTLLTIVNDILDFSKVEAGRLELERVEFNLRSVLDEVTKTFALRAYEKNIELLYEVSPQVPERVAGDPTRLRQIVGNLVGNAVKFTDRGEVLLKVETESWDADSVTLHFAVRDTGIGIPADKQEVIFEAFSQADGSMTRRFGGTGLGLTISSRLAEAMGGRLWVESELGTGSVFHFTGRFEVAGKPAEHLTAADELKGRRVLVVDNNASSRRILSGILQAWGLSTLEAASAPDALALLGEAARALQVDMIVAYSCMPGMDGFDLVAQLRQRSLPNTPAVIMLTLAGRRCDIARCRELGIRAHLTKPVSEAALHEAVLQVLSPQSGESKASAELVVHHCVGSSM